ncbi:MAG: CTP-dependent riboflavin kinase [Sulfuritalea sp.]|nr:CTP-dependent riboflavin kinase [Sulfuritalea sp.]
MTSIVFELEGKLCSGLGEGAKFTQLEWAEREFLEKLGFSPYPGTLNLSLAGSAWANARSRLHQAVGIPIVPPQGFCASKCFEVLINEQIEAAAVLPDIADYPTDKFEVLAPVAVRQKLDLQDGDIVRLRIKVK